MPSAVEVTRHRLAGPGRQDPERLLAFVGAHAVAGVETWDGTTYTRSLDLAGGPAVAAVTPSEGGYDVTLLAEPGGREQALVRLRHLLAVDLDLTTAQERLAADPLLGSLVAVRPWLRPPGSADHAETLVRTVIGQQVSLAGARTLGARLVTAHGRRLPLDRRAEASGVTHLWPGAAVLACLDPADPALAMPASRARTVVAAAGAVVAAGGGLPSGDELLALPGVGPWTRDYVLLRCRPDPDVFLAGDLAVRRALERLGSPSSPAAVTSTAQRWRPYRSLALMHLWADYLGL